MRIDRRVVVYLVLLALGLGVTLAVNFSPSKIPFPYEPNQIVGKKLGGVSIEATDFMLVDVNCTHPQHFPFVITLVDPPAGMYIINDVDDWRLQWTPDTDQVGTWYIVLEATDSPPPPHRVKSKRGTIVIQVVALNEGPILWPLEDSLVVTYNWPADYQKRWQELKKKRTILLGPVNVSL